MVNTRDIDGAVPVNGDVAARSLSNGQTTWNSVNQSTERHSSTMGFDRNVRSVKQIVQKYLHFIDPQWLRELILQLRPFQDMELCQENKRTVIPITTHIVTTRADSDRWDS